MSPSDWNPWIFAGIRGASFRDATFKFRRNSSIESGLPHFSFEILSPRLSTVLWAAQFISKVTWQFGYSCPQAVLSFSSYPYLQIYSVLEAYFLCLPLTRTFRWWVEVTVLNLNFLVLVTFLLPISWLRAEQSSF